MARLTPDALSRLKPYERTPSGRIKNYFDPQTRYVWSARQFRQARAGGVRGETITAARKTGANIPDILARARAQGERIEHLIDSYQDREQTETGKKRSRDEILRDPKFWKALDGLTHNRSRSPNGVKAKALEEFGLRPRNASWKVGESPKKKPRFFR